MEFYTSGVMGACLVSFGGNQDYSLEGNNSQWTFMGVHRIKNTETYAPGLYGTGPGVLEEDTVLGSRLLASLPQLCRMRAMKASLSPSHASTQ